MSARPNIKLIPFEEIQLGTQRRDLIKDLIPRVGLTIVWGAPKHGKSFWMLDMAMHVALGWPYRDRTVHQGPVVYCAFEGQSGMQPRIQAFRQRCLTDHCGCIPFFLQPVVLDLVEDQTALIEAIRQMRDKPVLVVLDTLNRSLIGSESSDQDMSAYVRAADAIKVAFDCAVCIVHHSGHDGGRPRGHSALTGAADAQISVKREDKNIVVTVELAKDGPQGERLVSRLERIQVGVDQDEQPISSCVVMPVESAGSAGRQRVEGRAKVALDQLMKLIGENGVRVTGDPQRPAGACVVSLSVWRSRTLSEITSSSKPDSGRKAFDRARKVLEDVKLVEVSGDDVWLTEEPRTSRTPQDKGDLSGAHPRTDTDNPLRGVQASGASRVGVKD